jgi:Ca2+-binding RTX toxin-like protein
MRVGGVLLLGVLVSGLWMASSFGPAAEASHVTKCFGKRPTQMNRSHDPSGSFLVGTARQDVIISSEWGDHIEGRGGPDFICALGGNEGESDEVLGGPGSDKLNGGTGPDTIRGGKGNDLLRGGTGHDQGSGGPGFDTCVNIEDRTSCEVVK